MLSKPVERRDGGGLLMDEELGTPSSLLVKNYCFAGEHGGMEESPEGHERKQASLCRSTKDIGLEAPTIRGTRPAFTEETLLVS